MEAILEKLVQSPKFPRYVGELNEVLRLEDVARKRFRETLDEDVREEFINGEVVTHMPARDRHSVSVQNIGRLLSVFVQINRLGAIRSEQALTEFSRNDYAPDICFWRVDEASRFAGDTLIYPVPAFICEVLSPSTESRDRGVKFEDYAAHGVLEYWMVDSELKFIEQYFLRESEYQLAGKFTEGVIHSRAIEHFEMPVAAAFDDQANLEALRKLLAAS